MSLTIGEVVRRTGQAASTIRYYEEIGRSAIARAELVRGWLEAAAGCRCPSLDDCPLFDDPLLPALPQRHVPGTAGSELTRRDD